MNVIPGDKMVTLTWDSPSTEGTAQVIGYILQNLTTAAITELPASPTTVIRGGLVNGQSYTFMIRAVGTSGPGSAVITEPVTPFGVPTQPLDVNWVADSSGSVTLTWVAPSSDGGSAITMYIVRAVDADDRVIKQIETGPAATSATIAITPGSVTVRFRVIAVNAGGEGAASDVSEPYTSP